MKKIGSILLAFMLVFALSINAFAAVTDYVYGDGGGGGGSIGGGGNSTPTKPDKDDTAGSGSSYAETKKPVEEVAQSLQKAGVTDVKANDWAATSISVLLDAGFMSVDKNGSFHPEAEIKADQGIAVVAKVLGIAAKTDTPEMAVQKAVEAGLIGKPLASKDSLSRMDVAKMLAKTLGITSAHVTIADFPFADSQGLTQQDMAVLKALYDRGIFKGNPNPNGGKPIFNAGNKLTNAQLAVLIDRLTKK